MNLETRMWGDSDRVNRLTDSNTFPLRYDLFDNDCVYFDKLRSKSCSLVSENGGGVDISWDAQKQGVRRYNMAYRGRSCS